MLQRFGIEHCNSVVVDIELVKEVGSNPADLILYQYLIGSLICTVTATRPDISYAVGEHFHSIMPHRFK